MVNVYRKATKEEFQHPIMDQVMPLIAFEDRNGLVAGTCVLIAPYLALTARHVVETIHRHFGKDAWKDKNVNLDIYPTQFNTGRIWYVSQVFAWVGTDIAFLRLQPRSEQAKTPDPQFLKMTVDPPAIGSEITALGYPKTEIAVERNDHEVTALKLNIYPTVSTGLEPNREYAALELARRGHIKVFGYERIEFFKHENGSDGVRRKQF